MLYCTVLYCTVLYCTVHLTGCLMFARAELSLARAEAAECGSAGSSEYSRHCAART